MDVQKICADGQAAMVRKELHAGLLLSDLSLTKVCPHFVEFYQIFQFAFAPPKSLWSNSKRIEASQKYLKRENPLLF